MLLAGVALVTNVGLALAFIALRSGRISSPWPWADTELLLLGTLSATILFFAVYLTIQERRVSRLRSDVMRANEETSQQMKAYYDRLVALLNVSRVIATETDPQVIFNSITQTCLETFNCKQASLMMFNNTDQKLEVRSVSGDPALAEDFSTVQTLGQGIAGYVAKERRPIVLGVGGISTDESPFPPGTPLPAAAIVVPILLRGQLLGVLSMASDRADAFRPDEDFQALQVFAETAGICCRHAEQTDWMRQTIHRLDATLQKLGIDENSWAA